MKPYFLLLFLFFIMRALGQPYYEVNYKNKDGTHLVKLTVGSDEFRNESMAGTMIKAKADSNIFLLFTKNKKTSYTNLGTANVTGGIFPESCDEEQLFKNDTIYFNIDTLINGIHCKKVSFNCIRSIMNEQKRIVPHDTIWHIYYVAPQIQTLTPMSLTSGKVRGLILKYVEERVQYSMKKGALQKSGIKKEILSSVKKMSKVPATTFKIPIGSTFYKTVDELWEHL